MATDRDQLYRKMAARGKYQRLYIYLGSQAFQAGMENYLVF